MASDAGRWAIRDAVLGAASLATSPVVCAAAPGLPMIYVSSAFAAQTGCAPGMMLGRYLAPLRGARTEPQAVGAFRYLTRICRPGTVRITTHRRDGTAFVHLCELRPVFTAAGTASHLVAVQRPLA